MQRGRFAQEFLAELMREPRALRLALLGERARWLRQLKVSGREELLFELELLLRGLEHAFERRHLAPEGRAMLGQDFSEPLRTVRDSLHRASMVARRLTSAEAEQSFRFRAYVERTGVDDPRRPRAEHDILEQRSPDESLLVLRTALRALQGLTDQFVKLPLVTFQTFSDLATLGEQAILSNKYFRPPGALEFRTEYDRVGSVRLLELVKRVSEARARKALALGFLACFRLLRYLRYIPAPPVAPPRRSVLIARLVTEEAASVANYLANDVVRLSAAASEAPLVAAASGNASDILRDAMAEARRLLEPDAVDREALERVRAVLSEGAKSAASALAEAVEPGSSAAEIFDGQRARRERAERLRHDLWLLGQLLRACLEDLFPAMKGDTARAFEAVAGLVRFAGDFKQMGYYLLRTGDHEPFDRFFTSLEALTNAAPSPARDRHLYLEVRRFLPVVERSLALVNRRAELVDNQPDTQRFQLDLHRYLTANRGIVAPLDAGAYGAPLVGRTSPPEAALIEPLPAEEWPQPAEEWSPPPEDTDRMHEGNEAAALASAMEEDDAESALGTEPAAYGEPDFTDSAFAEDGTVPAPEPAEPAPAFSPDLTRRIWRGD